MQVLTRVLGFPTSGGFFTLFTIFDLTTNYAMETTKTILTTMGESFTLYAILHVKNVIEARVRVSTILTSGTIVQFMVTRIFRSTGL